MLGSSSARRRRNRRQHDGVLRRDRDVDRMLRSSSRRNDDRVLRCDRHIDRMAGAATGQVDWVLGAGWYRDDRMSGCNREIDRVSGYPWRTFSRWRQYDRMLRLYWEINGVRWITGAGHINRMFRARWLDYDWVLGINRNINRVGWAAAIRRLNRDIDRGCYNRGRKLNRVRRCTGNTRGKGKYDRVGRYTWNGWLRNTGRFIGGIPPFFGVIQGHIFWGS
jgi:hypothetical protein